MTFIRHATISLTGRPCTYRVHLLPSGESVNSRETPEESVETTSHRKENSASKSQQSIPIRRTSRWRAIRRYESDEEDYQSEQLRPRDRDRNRTTDEEDDEEDEKYYNGNDLYDADEEDTYSEEHAYITEQEEVCIRVLIFVNSTLMPTTSSRTKGNAVCHIRLLIVLSTHVIAVDPDRLGTLFSSALSLGANVHPVGYYVGKTLSI